MSNYAYKDYIEIEVLARSSKKAAIGQNHDILYSWIARDVMTF